MAVTSNDIANQAIQLIGDNQTFVTGEAPTFDNSTAGKALQKLYSACVATVQRQFGWDASRNNVALSVSGNAAPFPYLYEYLYPGNGIQIWQLKPASLTDNNNPLPVQWSIGNALVSGVETKVVWSNLASALGVYNNNPSEATWDPGFRESVVRLLASELTVAIAGKPDTAQLYLESGEGFETVAEQRRD